MTVGTRWVIVIAGLLGGLTMMLWIVVGLDTATAVITLAATVGTLALVVVPQFISASGGQREPGSDAPIGSSLDRHGRRRPWLVLGAGLGLIAIVGGIVTVVNSGRTEDLAGRLRMSLDTTVPPPVNLTAGAIDWMHWGYHSSDNSDGSKTKEFVGGELRDECKYNAHCMNRKQGGDQISDFTPIGNQTPKRVRWRDNPLKFSWSDGTPSSAASEVQSSIVVGLAGNGFQITVAADTNEHVLTVYASIYRGNVKTVAMLSDDSASVVADSALSTFEQPDAGRFGVYSIKYRAAKADQTLTVTVITDEDFRGAGLSLYGVTLR